jgi:hypothetical protein
LEGLKEGHCFFYGTILVLVVKNVESVSRLRVVVFDVALMLFVVELEAAACLAHILFIACYARERVDATSVIGRGGRSFW